MSYENMYNGWRTEKIMKKKKKRHLIRFSTMIVHTETTTGKKKKVSPITFCTVAVRNTNDSLKPRVYFLS